MTTILWVLSIIATIWAILTLFDILAVGGVVGTLVPFVIAAVLIFGAMRSGGPLE